MSGSERQLPAAVGLGREGLDAQRLVCRRRRAMRGMVPAKPNFVRLALGPVELETWRMKTGA